jgi:uncharacterized membrane protein YccC
MTGPRELLRRSIGRANLQHAARTTLAAVASLLAARTCRLPEAYWASITTLVVTQSTLGASLKVSTERLVGTVLGALAGALLSMSGIPALPAYAAGVLILGILCGSPGLSHAAYRFAGITLAIVLLIGRAGPAWLTATHRLVEVSIGIAVGLAFAAVWPERENAGD